MWSVVRKSLKYPSLLWRLLSREKVRSEFAGSSVVHENVAPPPLKSDTVGPTTMIGGGDRIIILPTGRIEPSTFPIFGLKSLDPGDFRLAPEYHHALDPGCDGLTRSLRRVEQVLANRSNGRSD